MLRLPTSCKQHETRHSKPASFAEARQATNPMPRSAAPDRRNTTLSCSKMYDENTECQKAKGHVTAKDHPPLKSCTYAYGEARHHISGHCERCRTGKGKGSIEEVVDQACRTCSQNEHKSQALHSCAAVAPDSHPKRSAMWQDSRPIASLDNMSLTSTKAPNRNICLPGSGQV